MRNQTPLASGEPAFDVTVHIVRNDFGHLGRAYIETDEAEADEATIMSGQYSRPLRVVVFNTAEAGRGMSPRILHAQCSTERVGNTAQSDKPRRSSWRGRSV